jgi:hypothetical protein
MHSRRPSAVSDAIDSLLGFVIMAKISRTRRIPARMMILPRQL